MFLYCYTPEDYNHVGCLIYKIVSGLDSDYIMFSPSPCRRRHTLIGVLSLAKNEVDLVFGHLILPYNEGESESDGFICEGA